MKILCLFIQIKKVATPTVHARCTVDQGSATFFVQRTGLCRKTFRGPALKININIQQLNFISAHKILQQ